MDLLILYISKGIKSSPSERSYLQMNILVIESNEKTATKVVDGLTEIFNDPEIGIVTSGDLSSGIGMISQNGVAVGIDLIVCGETVEEAEGRHQTSNGLQLMEEFRHDGLNISMIILTDEKRPQSVTNGIYMIHRKTMIIEARLKAAIKHFFPDRV